MNKLRFIATELGMGGNDKDGHDMDGPLTGSDTQLMSVINGLREQMKNADAAGFSMDQAYEFIRQGLSNIEDDAEKNEGLINQLQSATFEELIEKFCEVAGCEKREGHEGKEDDMMSQFHNFFMSLQTRLQE
jgi:hypothetical protein